MMKRKLVLWFILICMVMTVTGCWNRRELNELAVILAYGVDKKGDKLLVSRQVVNPRSIAIKGGNTSDAPVTLFTMTGKTLQESGRRLTTKSIRKGYVGHLQMLVVGEEQAKEGLGSILDFVSREHDFRRDFFVVIARGTTAAEILKKYTPLEKIPSSKMYYSLETSAEQFATTSAVTIDELMADIISEGKEAVLTGIKITGKQESGANKENAEDIKPLSELQYHGLAVFKKDKLIGWLNEEESKGYNFIQGKVKSTTLSLTCPQGKKYMNVEVSHAQEKTEFKKENGKPSITMKINVEGNVTGTQCRMDLTKEEAMRKIEKLMEKNITQTIEKALIAVQEKYQSDILGFGNIINREDPRYWKNIQADWDKRFPDLQVNIKVQAEVQRVFKTRKSFNERVEK